MSIIEYIESQGAIEFLKTQPVLRAYLFGSHSRDEATATSDLDLLVELDKKVDLFQFISIKLNLEEILQAKVDLISSNGISPRLRPYIEKDKILIYEKQGRR